MNDFGLRQTDLQMILDVISRFPAVEHVVIFGSRAKGNYKTGSDVDLSIRGHEIDYRTTVSIGSILNEDTPMPYFFDVVNYNAIENDAFRDHIDRVGKELKSL